MVINITNRCGVDEAVDHAFMEACLQELTSQDLGV